MKRSPFADDVAAVFGLSEGQPDALVHLYETYRQDLFFFAFAYLRNREATEEIVQDVFLTLWETRADLRTDTVFRSYLYQLTKNATLDALRHQKVQQRFRQYQLATAPISHEQPEQQVIWNDYQQLIALAVSQLPETRQQIFRLSREQELTYAEIAEHTGLSVKAVEKQMMKALRFVRAYLRQHAGITTATLLALASG